MIIGRVANLTQPHNGRGSCQYRNAAARLPVRRLLQQQAVDAAGRVCDRQAHAAAVLDRHRGDLRRQDAPATGVRVIDARDEPDDRVLRAGRFPLRVGDRLDVHPAQLDVGRFPTGWASSGELGHNLMDHHFASAPTACPTTSAIATTTASGRTASTSRASAISTRSDAEGLPPRLRLSGQREPRGLGARRSRSCGVRRRLQGRPDRAGPVAHRHRLVRRVPAVPREPHVPEHDAARQVGAAGGHDRLRLETNELNMRKDMMNRPPRCSKPPA